ncbi:MAG: type IV pilus modification PilV family protein [Planctomycetota bacterium]|jgi:prepilin-type N-terminal cleavage/methylation domain-containing protein
MIVWAKQPRRAFSLTEVLLAIFILGIGVIAVAALFPAGIAQQRQSVDDVIGPIVANNALSVLRLKLEPDDFGSFEEFGVTAPMFTVEGDWGWLRPGINRYGWYEVFSDTVGVDQLASEFGTSGYPGADPVLIGIPYNMTKWPAHPGKPPRIFITQGERFYPIAPDTAFTDPNTPRPRPQYVWDCMFRRFQGKLLVAIFVYRVQLVGGGTFTYRVPPNYSVPDIPSLPINLELADISNSPPWPTAWDASSDPVILGSPSNAYDPVAHDEAWQEPRQWLIDQNNNIHRVLSLTPQSGSDPNLVELVRPVSAVPAVAPNLIDPVPGGGPSAVGMENVVTNIWYIPIEIDLDLDGDQNPDGIPVQLTPVYVTVREL